MLELEHLNLVKGIGIEGDINSDRLSPRQVLIVNAEDLSRLSISPGALRENVILKNASREKFKPGTLVIFSSGAEIRLTFYCEPCKRVANLVDSINNLTEKRGILGVVVKSGAINLDDTVVLKTDFFPVLSDVPYERFLEVLSKVPKGKIITYQHLIKAIGVDKSYYRVIPAYIKKTSKSYPVHRILDSKGTIITHIPSQKELLEAEGIKFSPSRNSSKNNQFSVSLDKYTWKNISSLWI